MPLDIKKTNCLLKLFRFNTTVRRMSHENIKPAARLNGVDKNIWVEFSALAAEHKACNLGQGFPDFAPPSHITNGLSKISTDSNHMINQYTRAFGHGPLVSTLSKLFSPLFEHQIDPLNEIVTSIGGYGALFNCFQAFVEPGDEVIIVEPFFDCYQPMVKYAGGKCKFIPLRPKIGAESSDDFVLDKDELRSVFTNKTKAIVINTPNNPLGKIFKKDELQAIADLCIEFNCLCISDEVYEWLVFDGKQHTRIASLPGMWDRTLTIGSAGKTFSVTGWKLGWTIGSKKLMKHVQTVHQNTIYTCPTPIQEAVTKAFQFELANLNDSNVSYLKSLSKSLQAKRDRMQKILQEFGFKTILSHGGYFMIADASNIDVDLNSESSAESWDYRFVKWMIVNKKLATIPTTAFYSEEHKSLSSKFIRFCFCKDDETIDEMELILKKWKSEMS